MDTYDKRIGEYALEGDFSIARAEAAEFGIWYTVYKNANPFFRFSWERHLAVIDGDSPCFWIRRGTARIGGALLAPNIMSGLFLIPPYNDLDQVVEMLAGLLRSWSVAGKDIEAIGVLPDQVGRYQRIGFRVAETSRCMIRPTEALEPAFDGRFDLLRPEIGHSDALIDLLVAAGKNDAMKSREALVSEKRENVEFFFKTYLKHELHMEASALVLSRESRKPVGACLISSWEDCPLVYEIGVDPAYRGMGLARNMLKRAIGIVHREYDVIRLFVTVGNGAQSLYHKMGFLGGAESAELVLPFGVPR